MRARYSWKPIVGWGRSASGGGGGGLVKSMDLRGGPYGLYSVQALGIGWAGTLGSVGSPNTPDPRNSSYGPEYWLHRCEGFRVESPEGEIGTVRGLRFQGSLEPEKRK